MPSQSELLASVREALSRTVNPATGSDMLSGGHVQGLEVDADGLVRFQFVLRPEDPGSLVREARAAVEPIEGVTKVKIDVKLPSAPTGATAQAPSHGGKTLKPGSVPAPTPDGALIDGIAHVVAVSSGKGGVGKSTVAANLAAALVGMGKRVGLLDADIYGPDIPQMFGERRKPKVSGAKGSERIVPLDAHGVKLMSIGFLLDEEQPAIMRGPLVSGILKQFLEQVEWGELDYLIVDMPPGTGDAQLSLVQIVNLDGAVMVTTPQEVSTGDVRRAVRMFERVRTRVLGVVENMSGFTCPHCSEFVDIFGQGGGQKLATDMSLPFLGGIPLDPRVREAGDAGTPTAIAEPDSPAAQAFREIAQGVLDAVEGSVPGDQVNSIGPTTRRITLLTDFGTCDGFTGAVRGVIAGIAPDAVVEDITHDVPRGDVHAGAWTLATYAMLYPPGTIHVAVVDPGVGSGRRAIAARVDSQIFIAPDNGLLTRVLNAASEVVEIREHAYGRSPLSSTFHGRDVFAPAAAHMARGIALDQLGPRALGIVRLRVPQPHRSEQQLHGEVVHIDRFGNLITNIPGDWLPAGDRSALDIRIGNTQIRAGRCYADVGTGELLAYEGSARMLEIAVRDGSAAAHTGLGRGAAITVQVS